MNALAEKLPKSVDIHKLNRWLPIVVKLLLVVASAYTLAQLTWLLIPVEQQAGAPAPAVSRTARPAVSGDGQQTVQQITMAHLFGQYQAEPDI